MRSSDEFVFLDLNRYIGDLRFDKNSAESNEF